MEEAAQQVTPVGSNMNQPGHRRAGAANQRVSKMTQTFFQMFGETVIEIKTKTKTNTDIIEI